MAFKNRDFFAYQESGITPDAIGMAKGLGGGFPIGAIWINQKYEDLSSQDTRYYFWWKPFASVSGNAVIDTIFEDKLWKSTEAIKLWHEKIHNLKTNTQVNSRHTGQRIYGWYFS